MLIFRCDAVGCAEETAPSANIETLVAKARDSLWLIQDRNNGRYVSWCERHKALLPTWHETIRAGEISDYL